MLLVEDNVVNQQVALKMLERCRVDAELAADGEEAVEKVRATMEEQAEQNELAKTRAAVGDVPAGVETVQRWGHPSDDVCDYAAQNDVDLIVMGSHGRSAIQRALLGSVSNAVVNSASCAVTVVR